MQINFFVEAEVPKEATKLVYESLREIDEIILKKELKGVEAYWKMKDVYIVEFDMELCKDTLKKFLDVYSDFWMELGYPVDELLASRDNKECKYMKEGFLLVNTFL